ncbi:MULTISPECIES: FHA domain-containing protein [unclassified Arthrobacter]|uniref:FHA domain-containing protein n=1 Tax=unclassified Arthrobacter TaxID=235627 RepID=UPI00339A1BDA
MATANYTAGPWLGLLRSRTAVFLGPGTPPALVQSIWDLLEDAPEVHEVLHAVTSSFGVSLAQIPSFGIVDYRDALRVFLRGDLDLTVQLAAGPVELNGRDVTTWTERRLDLPEWYRLAVAGDTQLGPVLPLTEGVVLVQSLTVTLTAQPAGAPAIEPGGARTSEPAGAAAAVSAVVREEAVEPDVEPEAELEGELAPHTEPGTDADVVLDPVRDREPESPPEVSAETVIGLLEDESSYAAETPGPQREAEPVQEAPSKPSADIDPASPADQVPAHELTGGYDHLWEKTVVRRIEDAAVRDEPEEADAGASPHAAAPATDAGPEADARAEASARGEAPGLPDAALHAPDELTPVPHAPVQAAVPPTGLIDSVPWRKGSGSAPATQVPPSFLPPVPVPAPVAPALDSAAEPDGPDGDHDGHTVMKSDLAGMAAHPAPEQEPEPDAGPLVLARVCNRGHANPPTHAQCAACSLPLPSDAVQVARPRLGRMRVSTGELVDLDQSLVIGRQPSVSRVQGGVMPRLVQVSSPSADISRSHVEVRLEGWHVMLCDLKATNGTVLVRGGQQPRRLAQNETAILLDGDIAELGDDISLRFEEIL